MQATAPGPTLGVVGGGQLGRMLGEAAAPLGVEVVVSDPTPDPPAAPVVRDTLHGDFDDPDAVAVLAERADVLTYEIELADPDLLERVSEEFDTPVHPAPDTLRTIQDKLIQKRRLQEAGVPVPPFRAVESVADLHDALQDLGYPAMLKARRGGYDGRGNVPIESPGGVETAFEAIDGDAMVEAFVPFDRELSVIGVRGADDRRTFTPGENVHEEEILCETIVPARVSDDVRERAKSVARDVLDLMDGRGVFGIELFESDGEISVNEIAPRPHNSGHWTIEGALSSQFEQHVRAVLGWPLGATERRGRTVMTNLLGDVDEPRPAELTGVDRVLAERGANLHWYGKHEARPLRKLGHVTLTGDEEENTNELLERARELRDGCTFDS
ncbi:5-(carboxyamino)imidazole ribonucleotide synthase [Halococcus saccharolyticus]|uniref:N5-carboxyaminoimidazole ribonucleotide synthase n=1 Tax=Halococcus saccharolyticus DSM 5350 TaxID=1227455 RepID=M0MMC0_9EURY|nr:5-(carboxyamino)imidazole ribonucleotide synthase [Halococcus saccharolyticus]EMA45889.1 phosphoribosylaminoimidazole carboxylase, ATPase subunit [Halococcus saccharolyticus DSM 5350]